VYGRGGKPCRRCGGPIAAHTSDTDARVTYWCPACQSRSTSGASR
jgi:endonuclease-8